jgi:hypothetical protein
VSSDASAPASAAQADPKPEPEGIYVSDIESRSRGSRLHHALGKVLALSLAVAVACAAAILVAPAVAAHDGAAIITLEAANPAGDGSVVYVVRAVWDNDGHPAVDATVTAVAEAPDGTRVGPVTMEPLGDEGVYQAVVDFPSTGDWTVRFTVVEPPGTLEITESVAADVLAGSTAEVPTSSASGPAGDDAGSSTSVDERDGAAAEQPVRPLDAAAERSNAGGVLFFAMTAVIIGTGTVIWFRSRSRRRPPSAPPTGQP